MFTVTVTFPTAAEAAAFLARGVTAVTQPVAPATADEAVEAKTDPKPAKAKPAPTPPTAEEPKAAAPEPKAEAPAPAAETPAPLDYKVLQSAVFKLVEAVQKKGLDPKEHVTSIAKKHGGNTFKDVPAEKYAAALADVTAKQAEVVAMEEAVA